MKKFRVILPVSGTVYIEVEAEDKNDAINKALTGECLGKFLGHPDEGECHQAIVQGNVYDASQWKAVATELDDES